MTQPALFRCQDDRWVYFVLIVATSTDGGSTWTQHQITGAASNSQRTPPDGCTIRTDSKGNAYVFGVGTSSSGGHQDFECTGTIHFLADNLFDLAQSP